NGRALIVIDGAQQLVCVLVILHLGHSVSQKLQYLVRVRETESNFAKLVRVAMLRRAIVSEVGKALWRNFALRDASKFQQTGFKHIGVEVLTTADGTQSADDAGGLRDRFPAP